MNINSHSFPEYLGLARYEENITTYKRELYTLFLQGNSCWYSYFIINDN
jgi:hypothetical protein